jgi:glycosyltransferase involved in cell wall biosynthesis
VGRLGRRHDVKVITQITRQADKPDNLWPGTLSRELPLQAPYRDGNAEVIPVRLEAWERAALYPFVRYHHRAPGLSMAVVERVFRRRILPHLRGAELVHCVHNGASFYAHAGLKCARQLAVPFVMTPLLQVHQAHGDKARSLGGVNLPPPSPGSIGSYLVPRNYHDRFWLDAVRRADGLVCLTRFECEFLEAEGVSRERLHEVGVGPLLAEKHDGSAFRRQHGIGGDEKVVLFLGRKNPTKAFDKVLAAAPLVWSRFPGVRFVFVGPKEGDAPEMFRLHADPRIVEIDEVDDETKSNALEACDVFCMPSFYEALGGVFLEAWWFGKPVIAGDTPPLRELTGNGQGGLLVSLQPPDIASAIGRLLEDGELRSRLGEWGRRKVLSQYAWDVIAAKVERIYQGLVATA